MRVVDAASGRGLEAFMVVRDTATKQVVFNGTTAAGEDGAVRVYTAPGTYEINVTSWGYKPARVTAPMPGAEVRITLAREDGKKE